MTLVEALRAALEPLPFSAGEWAELADALVRKPPPAIRVRPDLDDASFVPAGRSVAWHPQGRLLDPGSRPGSEVAFVAAAYYVQDAGSLLPVTLLDARPGERICDLCASPGGKSTAILETLCESGWLLANEPVRSRLGPLELNLARHGSTRYAVAQLDPEPLADRLGPRFDAVLVDAPCSGQSLLGRGKQTMAALTATTVEHCAARQQRILDAATRLVRPGGRLVYATCTFSPAENETRVAQLLAAHPDWTLVPDARLAAWESPLLAGTYRLWPHRDPAAGAFAACLRNGPPRDAEEATCEFASGRRRTALLDLSAAPRELGEWGVFSSEPYLLGNALRQFAWPEPVWPPMTAVAVAGPELAFRKGSTWFPAYALAMRRDAAWTPRATMGLDDSQAHKYARGEAIAGTERRWRVATWNDLPLGWLKGAGALLKNHLPKAARWNV